MNRSRGRIWSRGMHRVKSPHSPKGEGLDIWNRVESETGAVAGTGARTQTGELAKSRKLAGAGQKQKQKQGQVQENR